MPIEVSAFRWVPPFAQGLVRDLRVRWALEEAGLPYEARLIGFELFESGAIVLYVGERSEALLPRDPVGRARAIAWMFAALNSVEPHVQHLASLRIFHAGEAWTEEARPGATKMLESRLDVLDARLRSRDHLEDRFTAGDLLMTTVLRILRDTDLIAKRPSLDAYVRRCETRPAFQKALADQLAPFATKAQGSNTRPPA